MTGKEIFEIYCELEHFGEIASYYEKSPKEMSRYFWRLGGVIGDALLTLQDRLMAQNFLDHSVVITHLQAHQITNRFIERSLEKCETGEIDDKLEESKSLLFAVFNGDEIEEITAVDLYSYCIELWKEPL